MKTILLTIVTILFFSSSVVAQEELMKFKESGSTDSLTVSYTVEGENKYNSWISLNERGSSILEVSIDDLVKAREFLDNSYSKYLEWLNIAEENNVSELNRDIDSINFGETLAYHLSDWNFAFGESEVRSKIILTDDLNAFAVIIPSRSTSRNEYIRTDTEVLLFTNSSDFQSFLSVFDEEEVKKRVDEFNNVQSLFD